MEINNELTTLSHSTTFEKQITQRLIALHHNIVYEQVNMRLSSVFQEAILLYYDDNSWNSLAVL